MLSALRIFLTFLQTMNSGAVAADRLLLLSSLAEPLHCTAHCFKKNAGNILRISLFRVGQHGNPYLFLFVFAVLEEFLSRKQSVKICCPASTENKLSDIEDSQTTCNH